MEEINLEDLELIKALQIVAKYRNTTDKNGNRFNINIMALVDALISTTTKDHRCPNCGTIIEFYVFSK